MVIWRHEEFWPNGRIREEGAVTRGRPTGEWVGWHPNGAKWYVCTYNGAGRPKGIWLMWDVDGKLIEEEHWESGTLVSRWECDPPWEWPEGY